ncbi:hypothetical protein [Qaidamihabitans albus]|uniref:hypothetical protein n=1 Tax=Qaidamihabitans albus TaxID=2795733 RepID=UPI0018F21231|nr:hypothetical protein [Qaidamihabitans albus]
MAEPEVSHGTLHAGMPYLRMGSGPALVFLPGLTPHHREPRGMDRRFSSSRCARWRDSDKCGGSTGGRA